MNVHLTGQLLCAREAYEQLMKLVPYRRIGEVEDIERVAAWLASDQDDYLIGEGYASEKI